MKRPVLYLLFILCSASVYAQNSTAYTNEQGHYTVTLEKGWRVKPNGSETYVYAPADVGMDSWDEKLEFSVSVEEGVELNDAFDFYVHTDFPELYKNFKLINQGTEEINGIAAKWATFTFSAQGTAAGTTGSGDSTLSATLQALFYVIKKGDLLYLVNGVTEKNLFAKFDPSFRTIIRTFRVKE